MLFFQSPEAIVGIVIALVVGITCHEFSHAFVADQLGDHRPRALGRVSLNPARHIEPMGALLFALAGFGWGRPVQVNPYALRGGPRAMAFVSAAGPLSNLVVASAFAIPVRVLLLSDVDAGLATGILVDVVLFNVVLGLFNLLPIPPLDGYRFALTFLPPRHVYTIQRYEQYGFLVLLALVVLGSAAPGGGPLGLLFGLARAIARFLIGA
ncbi:MAG: site-2 protease family protein [Chloroflexota bacterium]|nr:site-2 protease family protein [Chloroflexota bacterium]